MTFSLRTKTYFYWLISIVALSIIVTSTYYLLGGFNKPMAFKTYSPSVRIVGIEVKGNTVYHKEKKTFNYIKSLITDRVLSGELVIINYDNDTMKRHDMNRFIGVKLASENLAIPYDLELRKIESKKSYSVALSMHPLVMPNADDINHRLKLMAIDDGEKVRDFTLETFFQDNSVIVEMFVK